MRELLTPQPSLDSFLSLPPALTPAERRSMEQQRYIEQLEMAVCVLGGLLLFIWLISRTRP